MEIPKIVSKFKIKRLVRIILFCAIILLFINCLLDNSYEIKFSSPHKDIIINISYGYGLFSNEPEYVWIEKKVEGTLIFDTVFYNAPYVTGIFRDSLKKDKYYITFDIIDTLEL